MVVQYYGFCALSFFCKDKSANLEWKPLKVTVSAYNSTLAQTQGDPNVAAWGDTLKPGMKVIAVSRDLLQKGLKRNTKVKIEGMEGIYEVKDKMHRRWTNRIDLYMGKDIQKAKEWGRKKLTIHFAVEKDSIKNDQEQDLVK
ncbi:3D domain-containing protein [Maribacter halichondriae]|uniref:3D domain-containing protein n=1 Tax=Maribacter halichondriae TaxID=2980554 RepID=UPI002358E095|nr:hypothetical protein [Maribacter sp. Hal144]